jgi:hypothetical protein
MRAGEARALDAGPAAAPARSSDNSARIAMLALARVMLSKCLSCSSVLADRPPADFQRTQLASSDGMQLASVR